MAKNIVSEDFLFNLKSKLLNIPLRKVYADKVPADVLELMPEEASVNYKMAPISRDAKSAQIGMIYPEDIAAQNALRFLAKQENFTYQVCLITPSSLADILKQRKNISIETTKSAKTIR